MVSGGNILVGEVDPKQTKNKQNTNKTLVISSDMCHEGKVANFCGRIKDWEVSKGPSSLVAFVWHSEGCGQLKRLGKSNAEHELQAMTEGRPVCLECGQQGEGWCRMSRERKARPTHGEGRVDHIEELGVGSDYARNPLKAFKVDFKTVVLVSCGETLEGSQMEMVRPHETEQP